MFIWDLTFSVTEYSGIDVVSFVLASKTSVGGVVQNELL